MCSKSLLVFFCYLTNYHKFIRSQHIFFNFTSFLWQKSGYSWARLLFSVSKCCNQGISQAALLPRVLIWAHLVVGRIQFLAIVRLTSPLSSCLSMEGSHSAHNDQSQFLSKWSPHRPFHIMAYFFKARKRISWSSPVKVKVKVKSLSRVWLFATPWTVT